LPLFRCQVANAYAWSMKVPKIVLIGLLILARFCDPAFATTVFRCVGSDGVVRFQDIPCQSGENSRRIEMAEPRVTADPGKPHSDVVKTIAPVPQPDVPKQAPAPEPAISETLCRRADGSQYLSDSGRGERRAVPLGMLGIPNDSLADAYAGRNGIGVSAPGLRDVPSDHSRCGSVGALYTWVEDPCVRINASQLCAFIDGRIVDAERRLRLAFSDTSNQVRIELESLRRRALSCSR
jgi:hypothetical protein